MRRVIRLGVSVFCCLAILGLSSRSASAQAWLPFEGELNVTASFQRVDAHGHFLTDGSKLPGYRTRASNLVFEVGYGITDRLALDVFVPFVNVKYRGPEEPFFLPDNVLDDGNYHGAITDIRASLRYNLLDAPLMVTPFVGASIPSHAYDTLGESAPGRNFQEFPIGVHVGRLLDPILPRGFVQTSYTYSFVRQDLGVSLNYSTLSVEAGYFVTNTIPVSFLFRGLWTHGGLSSDEIFVSPPDVLVTFDRILRIESQHVGLSTTIPLTESVSVAASYVWFVNGIDAHYGGGFSLGFNWTFQTKPLPILFPTGGSASTSTTAEPDAGALRSR